MSWIFSCVLSTVFLGCYSLSVKHAVHDNAVLPVLFVANLFSAVVWITLISAGQFSVTAPYVPDVLITSHIDGAQHLQLMLKAVMVGIIWMLIYFGMKNLPVSLASPILSTNPVWMVVVAIIVLGERLSVLQWLGVAITLTAFVSLSRVGSQEGVCFLKNRAVWLVVCGVLLSAPSGLYDKWLLAHAGFSSATLQAGFSIYLALLFLPLAVGWKLRLWERNRFTWRWSILLVSVFLLLSDFFFFQALRSPDGLLSLVACFRRGEVLVVFAGGIILFGEKNIRQKLPIVALLLTGIGITMLG
ncbi:MAG: EamA family transporter [Verrucomicrobiota bacterium JB024]|nr:EamA family transporter [Verrucomicrobiota bacterium JB024]